MNVPREKSCPFLASRWNREERSSATDEGNACYLWEESGVPPDVVQYCGGLGRWHGEPYVPIPVEMQYAICTQEHYGSCRWIREQRWHTRESGLVCPLLGAPVDRHHKYLYPTLHNVCHGEPEVGNASLPLWRRLGARFRHRWNAVTGSGRWTRVDITAQQEVCLTQRYVQCPRYREGNR